MRQYPISGRTYWSGTEQVKQKHTGPVIGQILEMIVAYVQQKKASDGGISSGQTQVRQIHILTDQQFVDLLQRLLAGQTIVAQH